jgi:hypothetical protein
MIVALAAGGASAASPPAAATGDVEDVGDVDAERAELCARLASARDARTVFAAEAALISTRPDAVARRVEVRATLARLDAAIADLERRLRGGPGCVVARAGRRRPVTTPTRPAPP